MLAETTDIRSFEAQIANLARIPRSVRLNAVEDDADWVLGISIAHVVSS